MQIVASFISHLLCLNCIISLVLYLISRCFIQSYFIFRYVKCLRVQGFTGVRLRGKGVRGKHQGWRLGQQPWSGPGVPLWVNGLSGLHIGSMVQHWYLLSSEHRGTVSESHSLVQLSCPGYSSVVCFQGLRPRVDSIILLCIWCLGLEVWSCLASILGLMAGV